MKVLQINAVYGFKSTGIIAKDIQQAAARDGIDAYVAFAKGFGRPDARTYEIGSSLDRKCHALLSRIAGKQSYFSYRVTKNFIGYLDHLRPDIVHLHNLHNNYINLNLLLRYLAEHKIKTLITLHDCWYFTGGCFHYTSAGCDRWKTGCSSCPKRMDDTPAYLFDASSSIFADRVKYLTAIEYLTLVGCSQWITDECRKSFLRGKRIECIHNGFDTDILRPQSCDLRQKLNLTGKKVILGPASKWLMPINRPAFDYFVSRMPDNYVLLLFGCPDANLVMPDNVRLFGYTSSRDEIAQLYSTGDVLVNCSREDTLSSINLEAQACGTPVVTYDSTGSKETVSEGTGYAVKTGDVDELWNKTYSILLIGKSGYVDKCRQFVVDNFDKRINYSKYIDLYKSL